MSDAPPRIRRAVPGDEAIVRQARLAALLDSPIAFESTFTGESSRTPHEWRRWLERGAIFVLEHAGEPKGIAAGVAHSDDPTAAFLVSMWVHPELRGLHAADALVQAVLDWARSRSATQVFLHVTEPNLRARRFYERMGFQATGLEFIRARDGLPEVEMVYSLAPTPRKGRIMISGAHSIIYSKRPEADRVFFRDVLRLPAADAGEGWLIFGLPPSEVAFHPSEQNDIHEFYLICDDIGTFIAEATAHGIVCEPAQEMNWGILTQMTLPGGGKLGVYEPRHARPEKPAKAKAEAAKAKPKAKTVTKKQATPKKKTAAKKAAAKKTAAKKKSPATKKGKAKTRRS
jgi:GNAT superfamily N-acetyltransferase